MSPVYGLAADRVVRCESSARDTPSLTRCSQVQVKVVTPNGQYLVANECQHPDLFFALRGGGGPSFGVVIESTHRLEPQLTLQVCVALLHSTTRG